MEQIHVDMLGPFAESNKSSKYILMVVDQFTKWVQCFPVPDQASEVVCWNLIEHCFSNLGMPLRIHIDQGRNFQAALFKVFEITKTQTTPYRPCSHGQVEHYKTRLGQASVHGHEAKHLSIAMRPSICPWP